MKLLHILRWLVLLLGTLLALQLMTGSTTPPRGAVDELFDRYSDQEGVRAAVIHGMPINDTLSKDILLLTATDSAGWAWMITELTNIEEGTPLFSEMMHPCYSGILLRQGTIEFPGTMFQPPEGMTIYEAQDSGICSQLLHVVFLMKQRVTWITTLHNKKEFQAITDLAFEDSGMNDAEHRDQKKEHQQQISSL